MKRLLLILCALACAGMAQITARDPRWRTNGVGALAARPATCTANRDVYVCNGTGCAVNGEYHYCTAANTYTVASGAIGGPPTGAAGGDLSGTYPNPGVATVAGVTAANVAAGANLANAATALNTASAIIRRDAGGNFAGGIFTGAVTGNASTATALAADPGDCTNQFARGVNASGTAVCASVAGTDFANQTANLVFAGPSAGGAAAPTFRSLVLADLPGIASTNLSDTATLVRGGGSLTTAGRAVFASGAGAVAENANFYFSGTEFRVTDQSIANVGMAIYYAGGVGSIASYNWGGTAWIPMKLTASGGDQIYLNTDGTVKFSSLAGSGNQFVCVDNTGKLYKSGAACL